eukprot:1161314-Pelagomonas_calceolata.AAC.4
MQETHPPAAGLHHKGWHVCCWTSSVPAKLQPKKVEFDWREGEQELAVVDRANDPYDDQLRLAPRSQRTRLDY